MNDWQIACCDVCIVSWRTRELLRACLRSVAGQPEVARVIVVDNASGDGTVEMVRSEFPNVHLIANTENVRYAAGNNQALRAGEAPFVLLLNPDTELRAGALSTLLAVFAEHERIGAVAPQLLRPDGRVERSCRGFPEPRALLADMFGLSRLFFWNRKFSGYRLGRWKHNSRRQVEQPMASALMLRRAALNAVGLFDEAFPLYFNDVDLCYRIKQAGWRIEFEPEAQVLHHHGQSTRQVRRQALIESHRSLIRFYRKHYRRRVKEGQEHCSCPTGKVGWLGYAAVVALTWLAMYPRAMLARR